MSLSRVRALWLGSSPDRPEECTPRASEWMALLLTFALNSAIYGYCNAKTAGLPLESCWDVRIFEIDHSWPLWPWTVWLYASYPPLLLLSYSSPWKRLERAHFLAGLLIINLISDLVFVGFPSALPRPLALTETSSSARFLNWIWTVDAARNCCPSLHVSVSLFTALAIPRSVPRLRGLAIVWSIAIAGSTLTTAQHSLIDLIVGAGLALLVKALLGRLAPSARSSRAPEDGIYSGLAGADSEKNGGSSLGLIA